MKYFYTLFFCLLSLSAAIPLDLLDAPPLPGRTGIYQDPITKLTTFHYGDDDLPEHMGHLQRNQAAFPENREPMKLAANKDKNRRAAMKNIAAPFPHPVTKYNRVRDEKPLAMLENPNHGETTTVGYLHEYESLLEAKKATTFRAAMNKEKGKGELRPNPGWLPIDPSQRRGHEAPARLNSQVLVGPRPPPKERDKPKTDGKGEKEKRGPNKLRPGPVMPVWKPSTKELESKASHVGAPGPVKDAEKRYPPRPQNLDHYNKQLQQKKDEEAKEKVASKDTKPTPPQQNKDKGKPLSPEDEAKKQKAAANLLEFEKKFGPAKKGEKVKEAPARLQNQSSSRPPARPAGQPATRPEAQGSSSKPAPKPAPKPPKKK